jgi:UDP-N-acetylglucosamine:LPS N-acetylglucosamine transferase
MARILFALDLGGGYGHIRRALPMADVLAGRGHDLVFAMRRSAYAGEVMAGRTYRVLPAPTHDAPPAVGAPAENWADILLRTGHGEPVVLARLMRDWCALYERERPDLVVCDFAPSALMAAGLAGLRTVDVGSGYAPPPRSVPMPPTRFWTEVPRAQLLESEARALAAVNAARLALGGEPLAALADTLAADRTVLNCFPEFDHYGVRPDGDYYGNDYALHSGVAAEWPAGEGPRIFAYLRAGSRAMAPVTAVLRRLGLPSLVHARDLKQEHEAPLSTRHLRLSARPVRMAEVVAHCAVVICHSPATAAAGLVHGHPVLMLPEHVEQSMVALRLAERGLAQVPDPQEEQVEAALRHALDAPGPRARAGAFARHYHGFDPAEAIAAVADTCEAVLA